MTNSLTVSPTNEVLDARICPRGGQPLASSGDESTTILRDYEDWLVGKSDSTIERYSSIAESILKHLASRGKRGTKSELAKRMTEEDLIAFRNRFYDEGYANATIRQILSGTNVFLKFLGVRELTMEIPGREKVIKRCPTHEEVARMVDASESNPIEHDIIVWLLETGARQGEVQDVLDRDVDLQTGYVTFRKTKNGHDRKIRMTSSLIETVRKYREEIRPEPKAGAEKYLHISTRGNRLNDNFIWDTVRRVAVRAGIDWRVSPHSFRHYKITSMFEKGERVEAIQHFVGHSSPEQTLEYVEECRKQKVADVASERTSFFSIEEGRPKTEPIDQRTTAVEKFLRGEMSEATFNLVMAEVLR